MKSILSSDCLLGIAGQGFAVGSTGGAVTLCEREADDRLFKIVKQLGIEGSAQNVGSLILSPAEDVLIASMDNNQMYSLKLATNAQVRANLYHNAPPTPEATGLIHEVPCLVSCRWRTWH